MLNILENLDLIEKSSINNIVSELCSTGHVDRNKIWETYCDTPEKRKKVLKHMDPFSLSNLMYDPQFKYGDLLAEHLIKSEFKALLINHALFVGYANTTQPCDIIISNYLWRHLNKVIDLYTSTLDAVKDVSVAHIEHILGYIEKHIPFEKWLDTKPSITKLKRTVSAYVEFKNTSEVKSSILDILSAHTHTSYIAKNIKTLELLGINETSSDYWTLMFNKTITKKINSNALEFITF